ncbi:MAG TPA: hypothetical protein PLP75_11685 [Burkholderiales bacterium]|nr:hypothetical protein [Burkholderiales bacterium]
MNQIKQFIQSNRVAIQRHWSRETDSIGLFEELIDLNGVPFIIRSKNESR